MHENVEGEFGAIITLIHGENDLSHIAGNPGYAQQARFFVQQVIQSLSAQVLRAHQISKNSGIDRARAGSHHQAFQWRESHAGVDTFTVLYRCHRAAVAKMAANDFERGRTLTEELSCAFRTILMIDSVESKPPNSLRNPFVRAWVNERCIWQGAVQGGIKDRDLWD